MLSELTYTFTSSDVVFSSSAGYYVDISHNLGHKDYVAVVVDDSGYIRNTSNLFLAGTNSLRIFVPNNTITGTWNVSIYYSVGGSGSYETKRLFEQQTVNAENLGQYLNWRLAFGLAATPTKNITLSEFRNFIQTSYDDGTLMLRSQNLNDVSDKATARTNLNVYSKSEIDAALENFYPVSGYISSVGTFVPSQGLYQAPTVDTFRQFDGIYVNVNTVLSASEGQLPSGTLIGSFPVTFSDNNTSFYDNVMTAPVSYYINATSGSTAKYEVGMMTATYSSGSIQIRLFTPRVTSFGDDSNPCSVQGSIKLYVKHVSQ